MGRSFLRLVPIGAPEAVGFLYTDAGTRLVVAHNPLIFMDCPGPPRCLQFDYKVPGTPAIEERIRAWRTRNRPRASSRCPPPAPPAAGSVTMPAEPPGRNGIPHINGDAVPPGGGRSLLYSRDADRCCDSQAPDTRRPDRDGAARRDGGRGRQDVQVGGRERGDPLLHPQAAEQERRRHQAPGGQPGSHPTRRRGPGGREDRAQGPLRTRDWKDCGSEPVPARAASSIRPARRATAAVPSTTATTARPRAARPRSSPSSARCRTSWRVRRQLRRQQAINADATPTPPTTGQD